MQQPVIFISYSHRDEVWKDRLVKQLNVLALEEHFSVWDDRRIAAGDDWYPAIAAAIQAAHAAILLISADFLTSGFIRREEIPRLLGRRAEQGLLVIPLILRPCPWERVDWLKEIQARPTDGHPLAGGTEYQIEAALSALVQEVDDLLKARQEEPGASAPSPNHDFHAQLGAAHHPGLLSATARLDKIVPGVNPYVTGSSLAANSPVFFGRGQVLHEVLATLRRPGKPGSVSVVGERRMGKSSLLNQVYGALACEPGLVSLHATVQNWNQTSQQHFFTHLAQAIGTATGHTASHAVGDYPSLRDFVYELVRTSAYRFVLLLDEFEGMASNDHFTAEFFANMRALGDGPAYQFGYVTASRRALADLSREHRIESSAFWNIFSHKVLGSLSASESQALVHEPLRRSLPPDACPETEPFWQQAIQPLTGGHPALLQMVLATYWNGFHGGYTPDSLGIETDLRHHLQDLWSRRSSEEHRLLIQAASGLALPSGPVVTELMLRGLLTRAGKPFCDGFRRVVQENSLPNGNLAAAAEELAPGQQRTAPLVAPIEAARGGDASRGLRETPEREAGS